jgi:hypothetical protein
VKNVSVHISLSLYPVLILYMIIIIVYAHAFLGIQAGACSFTLTEKGRALFDRGTRIPTIDTTTANTNGGDEVTSSSSSSSSSSMNRLLYHHFDIVSTTPPNGICIATSCENPNHIIAYPKLTSCGSESDSQVSNASSPEASTMVPTKEEEEEVSFNINNNKDIKINVITFQAHPEFSCSEGVEVLKHIME